MEISTVNLIYLNKIFFLFNLDLKNKDRIKEKLKRKEIILTLAK